MDGAFLHQLNEMFLYRLKDVLVPRAMLHEPVPVSITRLMVVGRIVEQSDGGEVNKRYICRVGVGHIVAFSENEVAPISLYQEKFPDWRTVADAEDERLTHIEADLKELKSLLEGIDVLLKKRNPEQK